MTLPSPKRDKPGSGQLAFSPLPFKHSRSHLTIKDVAEVLGVAANHVRDLLDEGELQAAPINHNAQREHVRLLRSSVEAWWLEQWFLRNGKEYPFNNSEEIAHWRRELRARRAVLHALPPSGIKLS